MEDVVKIASYISQRYEYQFGSRIDEIKLQDLLYFTQRECMVETGCQMFPDSFSPSANGITIISVHVAYTTDSLHNKLSDDALAKYQSVFDHIFKTYAPKDIIGLTTLIQNEYSWKRATDVGQNIQIGDIAKDAERIRNRRFLLKHLSNFNKPIYA